MSIFSRKSNASLANWRYQPETYSGSVPAALPPTNALLPTERKEMMDKAKEDRNRMATLDAYDEAQRRKSEGGFRNTMAATFKPAFTKLRTYPTPTREAIPSKRDERRFNSRFSLPRYEKLLYASKTCKLLSADMPVLGKIYISEHFLCFRESRLQPKQGRQRLLFAVPLVDIMSIQKGVVASTGDYTTDYRVLAPNELDSVRGEGLWIYTKDSKLHRFTNFWTQQAYDDTYIVLDRTWRRAASQSFSAPREQMAMQQPMAPTQQINVQPAIQAQEPVQQQRYCMTNSLKSEIVQSSTRSNLRHIASPTPKFSQIIFIDNGKVSAIDRTIYPANARSTGTTSQIVDQSFSQGETKPCPAEVQQEVKGFQRSALKHVEAPAVRGYAPLGHVVGDKRPWKQQQDYQQYGVSPSERPAFPIYYEEVLVTIVTPTQTIPDSLLNEVRSNSKRLRHVEAAARESPVKLGRVVDKSASTSTTTTTSSTTTSAPMQKEIRDTTSATIEKRVFDLSPQDAWAFGLKSSNQA